MDRLTHPLRARPVPLNVARAGSLERVSVVIPCFNYGRYLPDAVSSALAQEGADVEVIIVDDASTDSSRAVAERLAAASARVNVLAHAFNRGPVATFNEGLAAATGAYIIRLDADDLLTPGSVARALALFNAFPSVGLVYGHPVHFSGPRPSRYRARVRSWQVWPGNDWLAGRCDSARNTITAPEAIVRVSALDGAGRWQRELRHTHDFELWLRVAAVSDVGHLRGADQAWHRVHAGSLSSSIEPLDDLHERWAAFQMLFGLDRQAIEGSLAIEDGPTLLARAKMALAREAVMLASREYDRGGGSMTAAAEFRRTAISLVRDPRTIPGWGGLTRRMRRGPSSVSPFALAPRLSRHVNARIRETKWRYWGVN
ncbi:glycosyltransferase family 2 protein [Sinomonas flava]|uniref:glycosyltransferase family 2 protein n=1 Tax=Sinomonas flava TaxID=496857 RepID=UPI0039A5C829